MILILFHITQNLSPDTLSAYVTIGVFDCSRTMLHHKFHCVSDIYYQSRWFFPIKYCISHRMDLQVMLREKTDAQSELLVIFVQSMGITFSKKSVIDKDWQLCWRWVHICFFQFWLILIPDILFYQRTLSFITYNGPTTSKTNATWRHRLQCRHSIITLLKMSIYFQEVNWY